MMLGYYLALGFRALGRNIALTVLTIATVGVGIGSSMATLTIYRAMAANPIPDRSGELFALQIDAWGPVRTMPVSSSDQLTDQLTYTDALGLSKATAPARQAAMYASTVIVMPPDRHLHPFETPVRATGADFFPMFETPWLYGGPWTHADDDARSHVAVISRALNERLFAGRNSVGSVLSMNDLDYRIVGVLADWRPTPRFYDLNDNFGTTEDVFIPLNLAIQQQLPIGGSWACNRRAAPGWQGLLASDCAWLQMWVELPTAAAQRAYRRWLAGYAAEQQRLGRFHWAARTQLRNVRQWLDYHHVVLGEVSLLMYVSFGFLLVCLLNAMGLMLAKIVGGARDIAVRRALGARRRAVLAQCVAETAVVGLAGGLVGLALTAWALFQLRQVIEPEGAHLLHLDTYDLGIAVALAVAATMLAGLYPAWRAVCLPPAPQLKAL